VHTFDVFDFVGQVGRFVGAKFARPFLFPRVNVGVVFELELGQKSFGRIAGVTDEGFQVFLGVMLQLVVFQAADFHHFAANVAWNVGVCMLHVPVQNVLGDAVVVANFADELAGADSVHSLHVKAHVQHRHFFAANVTHRLLRCRLDALMLPLDVQHERVLSHKTLVALGARKRLDRRMRLKVFLERVFGRHVFAANVALHGFGEMHFLHVHVGGSFVDGFVTAQRALNHHFRMSFQQVFSKHVGVSLDDDVTNDARGPVFIALNEFLVTLDIRVQSSRSSAQMPMGFPCFDVVKLLLSAMTA